MFKECFCGKSAHPDGPKKTKKLGGGIQKESPFPERSPFFLIGDDKKKSPGEKREGLYENPV